jgi:hypothetical protein
VVHIDDDDMIEQQDDFEDVRGCADYAAYDPPAAYIAYNNQLYGNSAALNRHGDGFVS